MRSSGQAHCPLPKYVQDPTNTTYSIEDVFLNVCGFVEGNLLEQLEVNLIVLMLNNCN